MHVRSSRAAVQVLWALLFLLLPITSLPLISELAGGTMVAPASMPLAFLLVLVWFVPYLIRRGRLSQQTIPLLAFLGVALLATLVALFRAVPAFREQNVLRNALEALITLAVGLSFYLIISVWGQDRGNLKLALRMINWGGVVFLGWSLVQAVAYAQLSHHPVWMWRAQSIFSIGRLFDNRVTGLAFEPSWLAHQLNMLYLPYWFAATVQGATAHRFRLWKFSLENGLFLIGVLVLYQSLSRVGLLAFLMMVALLFLMLNFRFLRWLYGRASGSQSLETRFSWKRVLISAGLVSALLMLYVVLVFGVGYALSRVDYRMARLFDIKYLRDTSFIRYANQLVIAERLVFWQAGWQVFSQYPLLGVGLGNSGFFFADRLSAYSWALTEVRLVMYHLDALPNIKSLWVRLLAETGLAGTAFFASWLVGIWHSARFLRAGEDRFLQTVGLAGMFALAAFLIEGFSVDTFALPYYWVTFGLVTAACELSRKEIQASTRE